MMDNLVLNKIVKDMIPEISGKSVAAVSAVKAGMLLSFESQSLFFSLWQELPFCALLEQRAQSGGEFAPFAGHIAQHLSDAELIDIHKEQHDRVVTFFLRQISGETIQLKYQAIPRNVDLILNLVDEEISWHGSRPKRHTGKKQGGSFSVSKKNLFTSTIEEVAAELESVSGIDNSPEVFRKNFLGLDSLTALELVTRYTLNKSDAVALLDAIKSCSYKLALYGNEDDPQLLADIYKHANLAILESFEDANNAALTYFRIKARNLELQRLAGELKQAVKKQNKRLTSARKKIEMESVRSEKEVNHGKIGDLILSNMHQMRRGMHEISVTNYYSESGEEISIKLDPVLGPSANAEKYYKKARKARRAQDHLKKRSAELSKEENTIRIFSEKVESAAQDVKALRQLYKEVISKGWITQQQQKKLKIKKIPGRRFISSDGVEIIIGRSNSENDIVTFQVGSDNDFWMHAAGCPGSHLIIRNPGKRDEPLPDTITQAASLAAYFSKARNSSNVQVHWTLRRYVKKLKGGSPGKVLLRTYSSVIAHPEIPKRVTVPQ